MTEKGGALLQAAPFSGHIVQQSCGSYRLIPVYWAHRDCDEPGTVGLVLGVVTCDSGCRRWSSVAPADGCMIIGSMPGSCVASRLFDYCKHFHPLFKRRSGGICKLRRSSSQKFEAAMFRITTLATVLGLAALGGEHS